MIIKVQFMCLIFNFSPPFIKNHLSKKHSGKYSPLGVTLVLGMRSAYFREGTLLDKEGTLLNRGGGAWRYGDPHESPGAGAGPPWDT